MTVWDQVLSVVRHRVPPEDFRRWFNETAYASDSGDQITIWVPTESIRRHIATHYLDELDRALASMNRAQTQIRFVVTGVEDEELDE